MRRVTLYYFIVLLSMMFAGCKMDSKRLNERITLWKNDKIPYGAYYFFNHLKYIFPEAEVIVDRQSPDKKKSFTFVDNEFFQKLDQNQKRAAQIVLTYQVKPSEEELRSLLEFVWEGNYVFLSSFNFDDVLLDSLKLKINNDDFLNTDSLTVSVLNPETGEEQPFTYPGRAFDNYFSSLDSGFTTVLGTNRNGKANFIKIAYESGGAIYLHLAPMAFTNFFLLHNQNKQYYDYALSQLPPGITLIGWSEYFRTHIKGKDNAGGGGGGDLGKQFAWILKQKPLAIAFLMLLILFALTLLFESKRRQLLIPEIAPLRNSSLDFVKTIGRLYFQRKDNSNLASKMSAHFLDHIRNRYNISTSRLDDQFEKKLAYKSGYDADVLYQLLYHIKTLPLHPVVSDEEILAFNQQLENFYKHT